MQTYEKHIVVAQDDLDDLNHVNNVRYVQWVQDVAEAHWKEKTSESVQNQFYWILLEHHIAYKNPAILGDVLRAVTYVKESKGVTSIRVVEIINKNTDKVLVNSETTWCFINSETQKPARIPEEIAKMFD